MNIPLASGILGNSAETTADLTLLAYIFLIVPGMLVGFIFARRKMFEPYHKLTMTGITLFNWFLIGYVMAVSYSDSVSEYLQDDFDNTFYFLPTIHLITGVSAQLLGSYLVFRMWFEKVLPPWIMVKNIKLYMRTTLALWLVTATLGVTIYLRWYTPTLNMLNELDYGESEIEATQEPADPLTTPDPADPLATPELTSEPADVIVTPEVEGTVTPSATLEPADVIVTPEVEGTDTPSATLEPSDGTATPEPADDNGGDSNDDNDNDNSGRGSGN